MSEQVDSEHVLLQGGRAAGQRVNIAGTPQEIVMSGDTYRRAGALVVFVHDPSVPPSDEWRKRREFRGIDDNDESHVVGREEN